MTVLSERSVPVLIWTHEPLVLFSLPCPAEEGGERAALGGTWPPAGAGPPHYDFADAGCAEGTGHRLSGASRDRVVAEQMVPEQPPEVLCEPLGEAHVFGAHPGRRGRCGGSTLAEGQVPTRAALSLPSFTGQGRKGITKRLWVEIRTGRDHSLLVVTSKTDRT